MHRWLLAAVVASTLLEGHLAWACRIGAPTYWSLTGTSVVPGQAIPTDGVVLLKASSGPWSAPGLWLVPVLRVSVRDADGRDVPGTLHDWVAEQGAAVVWRPSLPLPASAAFTLEASTTSTMAPPPMTPGTVSLTVPFLSDVGPTAPFRLQDDIRVTLETYDEAVTVTCDGCSNECVPVGSARFRALRARIAIPGVEGGFTPDRFLATVRLTDDRSNRLPQITSNDQVTLEPGRAREILRSIPDQNASYVPCVTVRISDPAGHVIEPSPICLPAMDVKTTVAAIDQMNRSSLNGALGCAVPATAGDGGFAGLVLALALAGVRRRRRR